jgi:hypothetical protein
MRLSFSYSTASIADDIFCAYTTPTYKAGILIHIHMSARPTPTLVVDNTTQEPHIQNQRHEAQQ